MRYDSFLDTWLCTMVINYLLFYKKHGYESCKILVFCSNLVRINQNKYVTLMPLFKIPYF